ncbi:MAG: glycosyltransferase family 39 protein [Thermodesulfovibrionia bacterium]|nr:glycosyltransferase family 39 protein [Thermodesulfovibrionia bacterium]
MKETINKIRSLVDSREQRIVLILALMVFIAGVIYSVYLGDNIRFQDELEYHTLAENLVLKHKYTLDGVNPSAFRPPVYPFLLSIILFIGGGITSLRLINFLAFSASIFLLYLIVKNHSSAFAGLLSAVLVICYPVLFYGSGILMTEPLGFFLFLLILLLISSEKANSLMYFLITGLFCGLLLHTVPYYIFSLAVIFLWLIITKKQGRTKALSAIFLSFLLIISLWSIRNYIAFDSFVFVSTHGGRALYHGNFEGASANPESRVDYLIPSEEFANLNEIEIDNHYRTKAIEYIKDNKIKTFKLYCFKVLNYFNFQSKSTSEIGTFAKSFKDILMLITYGPLLIFFLLRLFYIKRFRPSEFETLLITLYLSNAFFLAILMTRIRFRLGFDLILIAVVAMFINNIIDSRS